MIWVNTQRQVPCNGESLSVKWFKLTSEGLALSGLQMSHSPADTVTVPCITLSKCWMNDGGLSMPCAALWGTDIPFWYFVHLSFDAACLSVLSVWPLFFLRFNRTWMLSFKRMKMKLASFPQTTPYKLWYTFCWGTWKGSFRFLVVRLWVAQKTGYSQNHVS